MAERASDRLGYPVVPLTESAASSPESVIRFLVEQLVQRGSIRADHADRAARQVVTREWQGSTALASGVAVPHSKTEIPHLVGIIGRSAVPIPWASPGAVPVDEVCLLLLPVDDPQGALRALEKAVAVLSGHPQ